MKSERYRQSAPPQKCVIKAETAPFACDAPRLVRAGEEPKAGVVVGLLLVEELNQQRGRVALSSRRRDFHGVMA
jgi:hypothetical protein